MLRWLFVSWLANVLALGLATWVLSGVTNDGSTGTLIWVALVFGVLNTILKPIVKFLTLPLAILTLGIAWFFVSMLMLWLTDLLSSAWNIEGFWTFVWATIIVWAVNVVVDALLRGDRTSSSGAVASA
jgi:putative membrane protein